jgi:hypothetical protein
MSYHGFDEAMSTPLPSNDGRSKMTRKPKSKLPAGWDVYSSANRKPVRKPPNNWWKYAAWALLLAPLAVAALYPWSI